MNHFFHTQTQIILSNTHVKTQNNEKQSVLPLIKRNFLYNNANLLNVTPLLASLVLSLKTYSYILRIYSGFPLLEVLPLWVFPAIVYVYVCFSVIVYFSLSLVYNFVLAKLINK